MGYWIAMFVELNVRGLLMVLRISGTKWLKTKLTEQEI
jgi:Na+-driven multidrug efflux pump